MREDFDKVVQALAPIARQLLILSEADRSPTARAAGSLLRHLLRELEDECPRNVSVRAAAEAKRRGYGDLRRYHYDDRVKIGGTELFLWEHHEQVRDLLAALRNLRSPSVAEVADVLRRARVAWILREEDRLLPRGPRADSVSAYGAAGIELRWKWEQSWPVKASRVEAPRATSPRGGDMQNESRERLVDAFVERHRAKPERTARYVNIVGPSERRTADGTALIVVEEHGSISFRHRAVADALGAPLRPGARNPPERNLRNYGEARWNLGARVLKSRFGSPERVAQEVVEAFGRAGLPW